MCEIVFTSALDCSYQEALDTLLFFNANQKTVAGALSSAIEQYGIPRVSVVRNRLWVTLDSGVETQSLFALEQSGERPELIGVVVYTREDAEIVVLFAAVCGEYTDRGKKGDRMLFFRILFEVQEIARRVKGIAWIKLFLRGPTPTRIAVRKLRGVLRDPQSGA